jgi:hypothetical protein
LVSSACLMTIKVKLMLEPEHIDFGILGAVVPVL